MRNVNFGLKDFVLYLANTHPVVPKYINVLNQHAARPSVGNHVSTQTPRLYDTHGAHFPIILATSLSKFTITWHY